jgi:hypothetical protein
MQSSATSVGVYIMIEAFAISIWVRASSFPPRCCARRPLAAAGRADRMSTKWKLESRSRFPSTNCPSAKNRSSRSANVWPAASISPASCASLRSRSEVSSRIDSARWSGWRRSFETRSNRDRRANGAALPKRRSGGDWKTSAAAHKRNGSARDTRSSQPRAARRRPCVSCRQKSGKPKVCCNSLE